MPHDIALLAQPPLFFSLPLSPCPPFLSLFPSALHCFRQARSYSPRPFFRPLLASTLHMREPNPLCGLSTLGLPTAASTASSPRPIGNAPLHRGFALRTRSPPATTHAPSCPRTRPLPRWSRSLDDARRSPWTAEPETPRTRVRQALLYSRQRPTANT